MSQEVEQIKERLNIAEVIGEYVQLKKNGNHHKGLCPFHQEKTPSFVVSPDKAMWHCFGCGQGGDVFSFIQQKEGLEFPDALKMLAERAGVELPKHGTGQSRDTRIRLFEVMDSAARFYHELLQRHPAGAKARDYLGGRGVSPESREMFQIGYAPHQWDAVQKALLHKGFSLPDLIEAGLVGQSHRGTYYDRFRGRIMFPIHDVQGRTVAFGGRIAPWHETGSEGKYVNSPETTLYEKRRVIFNLHRAKRDMHSGDPLIVVEGYLDVVLLAQNDFSNVVAASGTAFTAQHAALLKRYTSTVNLAFDADAAGLKAAQAATKEALLAGLRVGAYLFPAGKDPADIAQAGAAELKKILTSPRPLIEILLDRLTDAEGSIDRDAAFRDLIPFVSTVQDPVQQGEMIQAIAGALHLPEQRIIEQVSATAQTVALPETEATFISETRRSSAELLLGLVIGFPDIRKDVLQQVSDDSFLDRSLADLYTDIVRLIDAMADGERLSASQLIDLLPPELQSRAVGLLHLAEEHQRHIPSGERAEAFALMRIMRIDWVTHQLTVVQKELAGDLSEVQRKQKLSELQQLAEELSVLRAGDQLEPVTQA